MIFTGPSPSSPVTACGGEPQARLSNATQAATEALGSSHSIHSVSRSIAARVCRRASATTSPFDRGRPPGLPDWPFLNGIDCLQPEPFFKRRFADMVACGQHGGEAMVSGRDRIGLRNRRILSE